MLRTGMYKYKVVSATKGSSVGRLIRFLTNRAVCLFLVGSICSISLLISFRQYPYRPIQVSYYKQADNGGLQPLIMNPKSRRLEIRDARGILWKEDGHPVQNNPLAVYPQEQFNQKDPAVLSPKNPPNKAMSGHRGRSVKDAANDALKASPVNSSLQEKITNAKQDIRNKNEQAEPKGSPKEVSMMLSLEKEISDAGNASDDSSRQPEDYDAAMGAAADEDEYYPVVDPKRIKLVENIELFLQRRKQFKFYKQNIKLLPEQTKGVILLTNYRSGSTFLGELFNQHQDVFYTFEPLFPFTGGCEHQRAVKAQILHRILKCDFPSMSEIYRQVKGPMRKNHVDIHCLLDDFCFRKNTKEMCQKELCPPIVKTKTCKTCGPVHRPRAMNVCRAKKLSVIKAIRLCDIMDLKPILTDPTLDVKVIHLIRDPRGIESSRSKIHGQWEMKGNAEMTCDRLLHNGMSGLANQSNTRWLKGRYMRVRYEDLSTQPLPMTSKIYKFVGLDLNQQIQSWIKYHTETRSSSHSSPYGTRRDSTAAMQAWRTHLTLDQVSTVQSVCPDMMDFFGYKKIKNKQELNDLKTLLIS